MNVLQKIIVVGLLLSILLSYGIVFSGSGYSYINNPYWVGMDFTLIKTIIVLQIIAAVGFVVSLAWWFRNDPKRGILSERYVLFILLSIFAISSAVWPWALKYNQSVLVVCSLVITAITSVLLLAGSVEDQSPWWVSLGLLGFSTVTVLADGVMWNAAYITELKSS